MEAIQLHENMAEYIKEAGLTAQFLDFQQFLIKDKRKVFFIVQKFGAINHINLEINIKTIIIGKNNTGKSTIAKLLNILLNNDCYNDVCDIEVFKKKLTEFEIDFLEEKSLIFIMSRLGVFILINQKVTFVRFDFLGKDTYDKINKFNDLVSTLPEKNKKQIALLYAASKDKEIKRKLNKKIASKLDDNFYKAIESILVAQQAADLLNAIYIPAERALISILSQSLYSIISNKIALPNFIKDFGSQFELARREVKSIKINSLDTIEYHYENDQDKVYYSSNKFILLSKSASGVRCLVPIYLVMAAYIEKPLASFIIEEPEINLHPTAQKNVVSFMAEATVSEGKSFIVTTHSPYIISAFNNLIIAGTLAQEKSELSDEIAAIIPRESWINYEDVSAYILENGTARSILDPEWKAIVADEIDQASEDIGAEYDKLLTLKYRDADAELL